MKTMKCKSCGAKLKDVEGKEYVTCEYCGTQYKLDENSKWKIENKINDTIDEVTNVGKFFPIIFAFIIGVMIITFVSIAITTSKTKDNSIDLENKFEEAKEANLEKFNNDVKEIEKEQSVSSFNFRFTNDNGTKYGTFVYNTLDNVISSNKTNKNKQIKVKYNDIETADEDEIIKIKHSIDKNEQYEVRINYDDEGYINQIVVEDIK